jgi:chromate transporter
MLWKLFFTFFRIGLFTFGGGYAMIPLIQREAIEKYKWLSYEDFLDIIAIAESTPGPIAINSATYIGYKQKGVLGAFFATLGVALPSFIIILLISMFLMQYKDNLYIGYAFQGIRIAVSILILQAGVKLLRKLKWHWLTILLILFGFVLMLFHWLPTVFVILIGGIAGLLFHVISSWIQVKKHG